MIDNNSSAMDSFTQETTSLAETTAGGDDSTAGLGGALNFGLPSPAGLASGSAGELSATPPAGARVLVVEDDRVNSLFTGKVLESLGLKPDFAENGQAAVEAFAPGTYAAILMDIHMPVMDGIEATLKIREIEASSGTRVPISALTANVGADARERCFAAGMDAFLTKPFRKQDLASTLARLIRE